jgi:uncharacterized membrane protein YfcA
MRVTGRLSTLGNRMSPLVLHVLLVIFIATLIRSTFGFGEALVAVPLLALRLPVAIAAPLAMLVSITVAAVVVAQDWRHMHARSAGMLVLATLFGLPLGLLLLRTTDERLVKGFLALVILSFSAWSLAGRAIPHLKQDHSIWLLACGFVGGVLGGAYGMNGPPLVVYGAMRRWSAQHFRATLQGYFLPASTLGMAGYWFAGLWVAEVTRLYLWSLPAIAVAIVLGRLINQRMSGETFLRYVYAGLLVTGTVLLVQAGRS